MTPASQAVREVALPPELSSPGQARRVVRAVLTEAGLEAYCEAAELAVSELVTNAVLHAHTEVALTVAAVDGQLRVEVRDGNPMLPGRREYDAHATTGRGMALVSSLVTHHGVESLGEAGKVVWFELDGQVPEQSEEDLLAAWGDDSWEVLEQVRTPAGDDLRPVVLRAMPPTLWMAARQHHVALLRELVLYLAEHEGLGVDLANADRARGTVSAGLAEAVDHARSDGTARSPLPDGHPSPLPWVPPQLDLALELAPDAGTAFAALQDALDAAEHLAERGSLLVRPGLPEVVAVRDWVCEQVVSQLHGVPPSPWPGLDQERFETEVNGRDGDPDWDVQHVLESERGLVAADDANRIVGISAGLAASLGWDPAALVGRRVVTLIPAHLREGHVAGFTRHLTTGEAHVLGVPLTLPVLHRDGSEVTCTFLVEQGPATEGRSLYLAWIEPVPEA